MGQFQASIDAAVKGMEGYDKAADEAVKSNRALSGSVGSASAKVKELGAASNVGAKGLKEVNAAAGELGKELGNTVNQLTGLGGAFGRVGGAAVKLGRTIIAAIGPVGIAITTVVAAVAALAKAFFGTQRGADALQKVTLVLTTVFDRLVGIAQKVSFAIVDAFSNPKKAVADLFEAIKTNLINRLQGLVDQFKALGKVIQGVFTLDYDKIEQGAAEFGESTVQVLTGVDDAVGKLKRGFQELGNEIKQAAADGAAIFDINKKLEGLAIRRATEEAKLNRTISEQLAIARDVNKTNDQRKAAAEAAIKAQNQLASLAKEENALQIQRLQLQQKQSDTGFEGQLELAKLRAEQDQIEADRLDAGRRARAIISSIDAEAAAKAIEDEKKRAEAAAKIAEERLAIETKLNDNLDELRQENELAQLSAVDRAIEQERIKAAKLVEINGALYDQLQQLAKDDAAALAEIQQQQAESTALIQERLAQRIAEIRAEAAAVQTEEQKRAAEEQKARDEAALANFEAAKADVNNVVEAIAEGNIKSAEDASKALLRIALDTAEKQAQIAIASALAAEVGTKGIAGVALGLAAGAIITAAFAALKSKISGGMYEGGIVGRDGGTKRHNGRDGYVIKAHKGEYVMPAQKTLKYMPYLEAMRSGTFERIMATHGQFTQNVTNTAPSWSDRGIVGAIGSSTLEQRKQTELLAILARGLSRGQNKRYRA